MLKKINILFFIFSFVLIINSCERDEDYFTIGNPNGPSLSGILQFQSLLPVTPIADSITPVIIKIKINAEATNTRREIRLFTSLGTFSNNDTAIVLQISNTGELSIPLISNKAGNAFIRATINGISRDTAVTFTIAFPEDMILQSDKYIMDTTESAGINAGLFRNTGMVSDPLKVFFTVKPDSSSVIPLQIAPFIFSENKKAGTVLINPFHSQGWFTLTAATLKQNGDTLKRSIRIKVN